MKTNNILLKFILGAYLVVFFGYLLDTFFDIFWILVGSVLDTFGIRV